MPPPRFKAESQLQKEKLVNSYNELLEEFSSRDLRNVGNYSLGKLIGKGSFGKVYLASHKLTNGSKVVLKSSSREDANLAREIHHHRQFIHPHIARLYEVVVTEKLVWLVLEYCPGDELYNYLLRNGPMPIEKVQKIFTQLVGAVAYVHTFSTALEKTTLERMRSAGVNTDQVIENVLAQRCDALAGWWALLIEKEERKEKRRERKRREREAEAKNLRRLSAASSRLERISAALVEVDEENHSSEPPRSRGRANRRSLPTPQLLIPDLPKLPEGGVAVSPCESIPPPPIEKDGSVRSLSSSRTRPIPPPKERRVSRGSTLHLSASQPELIRPHGILKRPGTRRRQYPILSQLASLKHWLVESTKRAKSPHPKGFGHSSVSLKFLSDRSGPGKNKSASKQQIATPTASSNFSQTQHTPQTKRSSNASSLAPSNASYPGAVRPLSITQPPRPLNSSSSRHRNSLSPAPLTPRNSYRRSSAGLRGRKSTSSSVSSIRTIHHAHSHSKTSSISSNSIDTASTPTGSSIKALGISRSPHTSIKVLPTTPSASTRFPHNIRLVRGSHNAGAGHLHSAFNESAPAPIMSSPSSGLVFARRKRSAFKGPTLNTANLMASGGAGTPLLPRRREALFDAPSAEAPAVGPRKSQIIEEEEELFEGHNFEDEEVEEVEGFSPVDEKSPTFIQGRTSLDILASQPIVASSTDALTNNPSALSPVDRSTKSPEPQLLPAAEIEEPSQYPPFHPSGAQSDSEPIRPPRSSSLREHNKPGSTGSNAALERFESAEKPDVVQEERGTESLSP
ncbi:serine/threonine-protein kinase NIM1 [Coccidioides immitis RMSCC 3703]|uniref:Serine/threonine-protein kinase NIM1 n=1 Tax=Coccidioides immitis RMSCC 3703 TaxID=454286 RepID=A0A0J8QW38_COCIT|nr:serine/threonine-protein kinase NIM1 [Coccidioides immitis RMSCC 3703]